MLTPEAKYLDLQSDEDLLAEARRVLVEESKAIQECSDQLHAGSFARAARLIAAADGRVIVTGMGKSGAVGRKFAGTLSSTGTPAHFLHAAEGLHGDLGVVGAGDIICAFSYSGETDEIRGLLPVLRQFEVPIIAFTAREGSTLGQAADVVLNVEVRREACPMNLAPTTSTTVMLALSDALALVVMQAKHFTRGDYALRHPGGSLGRRLLLRVRDIMRQGGDVAIVAQDMLILDAMGAISRAHAGAAIVVDDNGKLTGFLTDGDFRRTVLEDRDNLSRPVKAAMRVNPGTVKPDMLAAEGLKWLEQFHPVPGATVGEAPVTDDEGKPVGLLTLKDLVRAGIVTPL